MDHDTYRRLQSEIGTIGYSLTADMRQILNLSNADEETKDLIKATVDKVAAELTLVARLISETLRLIK